MGNSMYSYGITTSLKTVSSTVTGADDVVTILPATVTELTLTSTGPFHAIFTHAVPIQLRWHLEDVPTDTAMTTASKVGIGIGVAIFAIVVLFGTWLLIRKRRQKNQTSASTVPFFRNKPELDASLTTKKKKTDTRLELSADPVPVREFDSHPQPVEIMSTRPSTVHELAADIVPSPPGASVDGSPVVTKTTNRGQKQVDVCPKHGGIAAGEAENINRWGTPEGKGDMAVENSSETRG
ncbi:hypothetical protein QBC41DRAFT_298938 [Cercophora samala]|uniref:Uncharacterized protein n=1 Tax=Cercophora samala TaxID=330535 RepID=A0AA40DFI2_9PEZI|nr:hypothetical protein QBC41DRAFT_298938 [Cercophora samala]